VLGLLISAVIPPGAASTAFELLLERQRTDGTLSTELVRGVAQLCGKSEDTIWRWLRKGRPGSRDDFKLNDHEIRTLAAANNNVALMHEHLQAEDLARRSLRTYQRAANASLTPAERGFFSDGDRGFRGKTVHMPQTVERRGQVFHADHSLLDIWLQVKQHRRWFKPWVTVVIDARTRRVMSCIPSLQPNEGIVLAALRQAFTGECGCLPDQVIWDNGAEWLADGVTGALQALAITSAPIAPYSPWRNGKVERFFGTLERSLLARLPFYTKGPRGHNKKLYGPDEGPLSFETFTELLAEWVDWYNRERPHAILNGATPDETWHAEPTAVRRIDERQLDFMLARAAKRRSVGVYGVRHKNDWYYANELLSYKSEWIDVRYVPGDDQKIWLFDGEQFIAEAVPWDAVDEKGRSGFMTKRSAKLRSARSKLPSASTTLSEPQPADEENADADDPGSTPTEVNAGDIVSDLNQAITKSASDDTDDVEPMVDDDLDGVNEVIE
jgi:transposase InsO family protein